MLFPQEDDRPMPDCTVCGEYYSPGRYRFSRRLLRPGHVDLSEAHHSALRLRAAWRLADCLQCGGSYGRGDYASHVLEERHQLAIKGRECRVCGGRYRARRYGEHRVTPQHLEGLSKTRECRICGDSYPVRGYSEHGLTPKHAQILVERRRAERHAAYQRRKAREVAP